MKGDPSRTSIEEHVDSVEGGENDGAMTEARLKKLVLNFEKKATKNQELRIKFPDEPVKFLNSEVELHDTIQVCTNNAFDIFTLAATLVHLFCR